MGTSHSSVMPTHFTGFTWIGAEKPLLKSCAFISFEFWIFFSAHGNGKLSLELSLKSASSHWYFTQVCLSVSQRIFSHPAYHFCSRVVTVLQCHSWKTNRDENSPGRKLKSKVNCLLAKMLLVKTLKITLSNHMYEPHRSHFSIKGKLKLALLIAACLKDS